MPPAAILTLLTIDSAGIAVPVLPLIPGATDTQRQSIVPPETVDGYWLASLGKPGKGSTNTVYVTGHSWENRSNPFSWISTDVHVGDLVTLTTTTARVDYRIVSVTTHNRETLKDSDISERGLQPAGPH
jgi:hypothetical protein